MDVDEKKAVPRLEVFCCTLNNVALALKFTMPALIDCFWSPQTSTDVDKPRPHAIWWLRNIDCASLWALSCIRATVEFAVSYI